MRKAVTHLKKCDPVLAAVITRVGPLKMPYRDPAFAALARSIVFQQLAWKAAIKIWGRVVTAAAKNDPEAAARASDPFGYVTPRGILALTEAELRACGLSKQKLSYIRDLAARTDAGEIDFPALKTATDAAIIEQLTRVKGIGAWTAQMFLMFALRRPNVLPTGDYGIRAAMKKAYRMRDLPKPKRMEKIARAWHPYCTVACWYLWRSLDQKI